MSRNAIGAFLISFGFIFLPDSIASEIIQQKTKQKPLEHEVAVTLKLVQVYVADKDGKPVTDLEMSDFILYDSGRLQTITEFEKHFLPEFRMAQEETLVETELIRGGQPRLTRKFFFIFDLSRLKLDGFAESKKAALHFLDTQILPSDEIGIITFSESQGMTLRELLSRDHDDVRKIIKSMKGIIGRSEGEGISGELRRPSSARPLWSLQERSPGQDFADMKNFDFIKEMEEIAKALRYIPGNKNIVLFSHGFSRALYVGDSFFQRSYDHMAREFASASSPIHTINTEGTRHYFKSMEARGDTALKNLSTHSGGRYFEDVKLYESINEDLQAITGNYYILGYYLSESWDGKFHEIEVKVNRKDCQVTAQSGYFNPKPFKDFSSLEKQLHLYDLALSDRPQFQESLRFPLIGLPCSDEEFPNLVMLSEIPFVPLQDVMGKEVEVTSLVLDEENAIIASGSRVIDFTTRITENLYPYSSLQLEPGAYQCRLILRNLATGKGAVGAAEATLSEPLETGLRVFPPLVLIPDRNARFLKLEHQQPERKKQSPALSDIYPFLSGDYSPLVKTMEPGPSKLFAVVRNLIMGIPEPDTTLSLFLIDHTREEKTGLEFSLVDVENRENLDILLLEFSLPETAPGEYTLEIIAEERQTQARSAASRTFTITESKE